MQEMENIPNLSLSPPFTGPLMPGGVLVWIHSFDPPRVYRYENWIKIHVNDTTRMLIYF